jgi:hypothetical protein
MTSSISDNQCTTIRRYASMDWGYGGVANVFSDLAQLMTQVRLAAPAVLSY